MKLKHLADAIAILIPYYDDPNGYHVGAEHDEIFLYETDRPLSPEDVQRMVAMGWSQDGGADEESPEDYRPDLGWKHFT